MKTKLNRLTYANSWMSDYYSVDKVEVDAKSIAEVKIGNKKYEVRAEKVGIPYNDMGNTYDAVSVHLYITEKVFGVKMEFDLNKIVPKTKVYVTKMKKD